MKRIIFTLAFTAMIIALKAQSGSAYFAQPKEIIGRRINASGEITYEYNASFAYTFDGKLDRFLCPIPNRIITYDYDENDYLIQIEKREPDHDYVMFTQFSYDEYGKLEKEVCSSFDTDDLTKTYYYYGDGRLARVDFSCYNDIYAYSSFNYENSGKTRIESYWFNHRLLRVTTQQYDDNYDLVSEQTDTYNNQGEITETQRTLNTYTPNGELSTEVRQNLINNIWLNSYIHTYIYDDGKVIEQQDGIWSEEFSDWDINKKTIHELSGEGMTYLVSFYKKSEDEWVWDVFSNQKLFFESEFKNQQSALESISGAGIHQFEFHMVYTERPTYMKVGEDSTPVCAVYPNPGNGPIKIEAPVENCVVRFYDLNGRLILAKPFDFGTDVATDDWTPGLYLWEIWNGTQCQSSGKWVKE